MYPLLPSDGRVLVGPTPCYLLDGKTTSLTPNEATRLKDLSNRLNGQARLTDLTSNPADEELIARLQHAGMIFDLPTHDGEVPIRAFCNYLYARISGWRQHKDPDQWPWRKIIAEGGASIGYLQGLLIENYHYVRAATVRQSPLLSQATDGRAFELVREFVVDEAKHERYFLDSLTQWGVPTRDVEASAPLTATTQFIATQYRLAHVSVLDYLAGSAVLGVDPQAYARQGDPYQAWETTYGLDPKILAPVREHIREDVAGDHAQLFREVAEATGNGVLPISTAVRLLRSARTVFEATRLWQREMYEHYQVRGEGPAKAGL